MKKLLYLVVCFLNLTNSSAQVKVDKLPWIHFQWESLTVNRHHFDKTAMLLTVTINDVPGQFVAQFDLGADLTMFYGNTIAPYLEKYNLLRSKLIREDEYQWLTGVTLSLDKVLFKAKKVFIRKGYGDNMTADSTTTHTVKLIGTIGADLVQNKVLVIDYKKSRLCIVDQLAKQMTDQVKFISYTSDQKGRVILPLQIGDRPMDALFDTGNSLFGFTSTKENWLALCDTAKVTKYEQLTSWGTTVDVWESPLRYPLTIKGIDLPLVNATLSFLDPKPAGMNQFFSQSKIDGLTGNLFFLDQCIIIDFKNKRFGIVH